MSLDDELRATEYRAELERRKAATIARNRNLLAPPEPRQTVMDNWQALIAWLREQPVSRRIIP